MLLLLMLLLRVLVRMRVLVVGRIGLIVQRLGVGHGCSGMLVRPRWHVRVLVIVRLLPF